MASKKPAPETEGFEALYKQLEETVAKLEQGNLSLEDSLSLYEAGTELAKRCQALLQDAELRVTRLQTQFNETSALLGEEPAEYDPETEFDEEPAE
jgi:exodeoxyribonuclease VII small subunit